MLYVWHLHVHVYTNVYTCNLCDFSHVHGARNKNTQKLTHVCSKSACAYRGKHLHGTYM